MSAQTTDAIVVGGGVMGCATAYHLARAGRRVVLLEQFGIGHTQGSSHGPSRIIRLAYDSIDYVRLAQAAYRLWRQLEAEAGQQLMLQVGGFDFGVPGALALDGIRATYESADVPFEALDAAEIMRRFPQFNLPEGVIGYYQPDYSLLAADRCVAALAEQARRHGANIHEGEGARQVGVSGGGVEVRTDRATYQADRLILCAGSWTRPLLAQLGLELPLTVLKEQLAYFAAHDPEQFMPGHFPLFIHRYPGTTVLGSGFPSYGHRGVKLMVDRIGPEVAPDDPDRSIDADRLARLHAYATDLLPGLTGEIVEAVSCRYTMTPDEDFVIDTHPAHPQIVIASPCSGHGFKFGAVIGEILAGLATRGATDHDIARFRLDRPALR
jgi:sarcosine oxidase